MKKMGVKTKKYLKGVHIFFSSAWVGAALSILILGFVKGHVPNGDELAAVNEAIKLIDDCIIIPAALGTLLSGMVICWLTEWGFFRFPWIIVKWILTIAQILFGTFFLGQWTNGANAIAHIERGMALQNHVYLWYREMSNYFGTLQLVLLVFVVFISAIKPWGKRKL